MVSVEDNVWISFPDVVLPGTNISRGAAVRRRTVVSGEIPAYAVVVGNPGRVVRMLTPNDDGDARRRVLAEHLLVSDG